ncbi:ABC transporter permease [Halocella sp. SP3-1]|uniref:ABC transporter permease n=1 Tax=Halocella sp. SP3-1 TaxID=2382161 RepID=UPI000F75B3C8|nr:ABC transporter permease [Halocella sp. SP3-1]AZO95731.1 ABC transporter permease [Halocella sp. SP3-1]
MINQGTLKAINPFKKFLIDYAVPIMFIIIVVLAAPMSGFSLSFLANEVMTRLTRNSFLILSLLIPVMAGMGMNFGIVLGAMAGEIGLIFITDWHIVGLPGILLAILLATPFAIVFGYFAGVVLNEAKGREMVTGLMLGFFMNGIYQLIVLYGMGNIIPVSNNEILLSRGYGIRNAVNLDGVRQSLDNLIRLNLFGIKIPVLTIIVITGLCLFIIWFKKTKLGQDMRTVGQDMEVARSAGIDVEKTRIIAIIISTVLASYGMIIYLQNIGTVNTYNSHEQIGFFAIAALLVGGASVARASVFNVFVGVILFHTVFIVSPRAGKELIGSAQLGEYFRVFITYGVIAFSLALYAWKSRVEKENERKKAMILHKVSLQRDSEKSDFS